jgi:predicted nicotinamide N-methyase
LGLRGSDLTTTPAAFICANTRLAAAPFVPEVRLHLADEAFGLWARTEEELGCAGLPPPFWAFPWAGGQALARYLLDHPDIVRGRTVFDLASGSGLVAIAAAKAGAASVTASDVDRFAVAAIALNAQANGVVVRATIEDVLGSGEVGSGEVGSGEVGSGEVGSGEVGSGEVGSGEARVGAAGAEVVLTGDVFYERQLADHVLAFLERAQRRGAFVLVGDPGRAYLPRPRFEVLATYDVPVLRTLEDAETKRTAVCRPAPEL